MGEDLYQQLKFILARKFLNRFRVFISHRISEQIEILPEVIFLLLVFLQKKVVDRLFPPITFKDNLTVFFLQNLELQLLRYLDTFILCQRNVTLCRYRNLAITTTNAELLPTEKIVEHYVLIPHTRLRIRTTKDTEQSHVAYQVLLSLCLNVWNHLLYYISNHFRRDVLLQQSLSALQQLNYDIVDEFLFLIFQNFLNVILNQVSLDWRVEKASFEQQLIGLLS